MERPHPSPATGPLLREGVFFRFPQVSTRKAVRIQTMGESSSFFLGGQPEYGLCPLSIFYYPPGGLGFDPRDPLRVFLFPREVVRVSSTGEPSSIIPPGAARIPALPPLSIFCCPPRGAGHQPRGADPSKGTQGTTPGGTLVLLLFSRRSV